MSESNSPDPEETISYAVNDVIRRICMTFEAALRTNSHPLIEAYLPLVAPSVRGRLQRELNAISEAFTQRHAEQTITHCAKAFPESSDAITCGDKQVELIRQHGPETWSANAANDDTAIAAPAYKFSQFKLLEIAGSGGFGTVWRAKDERLDREVAVKIPRSRSVDLSVVTREARIAAQLRHPNIVSVHEVGEENGTSFIVTDYIHGTDLKEWNRKNSINFLDAARLVAKLAAAIQYAHDNGVIHRDLKLANVLMDQEGEPHVADFGLAKREAQDDSLAVDGQVMGTPAYMAPEQARADHAAIDRRTDIYSLGVMLYELITGVTPFQGAVSQLLQQIVDVVPVAPRSIDSNIPKDLQSICMKCLAKENTDRYGTAQALADDLHSFLNGETLRGIPAALPNRIYKWLRRNRRYVVTVSTVGFLVACVSSSLMAWRSNALHPTVPLNQVEFITEPPGCEITVVAIDPSSGEADSNKIQTAPGRTPLTMSLASADYLVVAVLDGQRFHEVYRHVPEPNETTGFIYPQSSFRRQLSGIIKLPKIEIPRPDVSVEMAFCEHLDNLAEPQPRDFRSRAWSLPSFYVDRREAKFDEFQPGKVRGAIAYRVKPAPLLKLPYFLAVAHLESVGKRLPSAAELYALSATTRVDEVEGVHGDLWEWTSTKPGGPFGGAHTLPPAIGIQGMSRMTGLGDPERVSAKQAGFRVEQETNHDQGLRGVRSVKPRRSRDDFPTIVSATPNH